MRQCVRRSWLRALRRMALMFGVLPVAAEALPASAEEWIRGMDNLLLERDLARPGDAVVVVHGEPFGTVGVSNKLRIHYVKDVCRTDRDQPE